MAHRCGSQRRVPHIHWLLLRRLADVPHVWGSKVWLTSVAHSGASPISTGCGSRGSVRSPARGSAAGARRGACTLGGAAVGWVGAPGAAIAGAIDCACPVPPALRACASGSVRTAGGSVCTAGGGAAPEVSAVVDGPTDASPASEDCSDASTGAEGCCNVRMAQEGCFDASPAAEGCAGAHLAVVTAGTSVPRCSVSSLGEGSNVPPPAALSPGDAPP
mmetsp:Transcript_8240/g.24857  ORF Transcript_8240/g.24857 Transcript_8240/m.24857 type:complete len:218 (+) Transcript_8240:280-933(+)